MSRVMKAGAADDAPLVSTLFCDEIDIVDL